MILFGQRSYGDDTNFFQPRDLHDYALFLLFLFLAFEQLGSLKWLLEKVYATQPTGIVRVVTAWAWPVVIMKHEKLGG